MLGREAVVFEGASDEFARGRLVSLEGFSFSFGAKNEEWRDLQLVSQITFEWRKLSVTIKRVCVSKSSKEQICLLCTEVVADKDFRRKLISGGQKKDQTLFESRLGGLKSHLSAIARNMIT